MIKRRVQTEQLFDIWDVDGSGYLEINEVEMVLSKWREEDIHDYLLKEGECAEKINLLKYPVHTSPENP